jgi:hypothetical protein
MNACRNRSRFVVAPSALGGDSAEENTVITAVGLMAALYILSALTGKKPMRPTTERQAELISHPFKK